MVRRGEVYVVDWGQGKGSEQSGIRPSLVIQNDTGNQFSPNVIVASLTSAPNKAYPFLVPYTAKETGLEKDGYVDLASIVTISQQRLRGKCGQFSKTKMVEVDRAICNSLGVIQPKTQ